MAIAPTRFSRVSIGWVSSSESLPDYDAADTGAVFSVAGPLALGQGGTAFDGLSHTTAAVDFGSVAAHDSSSVTVALGGAAVGDSVIVSPASTWSGSYYDLDLQGQVTAAGVVTIIARNSTITAINPDSVAMRVAAINYSAFV